MPLARFEQFITDDAGNVLPNARLTVYRDQPGSPLAVLRQDRAGAIPLSNPFAADAQGKAFFHAVGGAYRVHVRSGTFETELRFRAIGTAADRDLNQLGSGFGVNPLGGRLSLMSGVAAPVADVTYDHVFYVPCFSEWVALPDTVGLLTFSPFLLGGELALQLDPTTHSASTLFDVYLAEHDGEVKLGSSPAWANSGLGTSARGAGPGSNAIFTTQGGRHVNAEAMVLVNGPAAFPIQPRSGLMVGTFRTHDAAPGLTADTSRERLLSNVYNAVPRALDRTDPATDWTYATAAFRIANDNPLNQVFVVQSVGGRAMFLAASNWALNDTANPRIVQTVVGVNNTPFTRSGVEACTTANPANPVGQLAFYPASLGVNSYQWMEAGAGAEAQTWRGGPFNGINGWCLN